MKKPSLLVAVSALVLAGSVSPAWAEPTTDPLIEELSTSSRPLETLDGMDQTSKEHVRIWLESASSDEVEEVFVRPDDPSTQSTSNLTGGYSDILWNTLERAACVTWVDLVSCNKAAQDAASASNEAVKLFPASLHNGRGDAFRHCYWNARMVHSVGESAAVKIATNHEALRAGPKAEQNMDMANNKTGRSVGKATTTNTKASQSCSSKATQGKLVTL